MENINNKLDKKISLILSKYKNNKKLYTKNNITNLVLSGGSIKGISHIGSLKILNEYGILTNIKTIACSSVGSAIAILHCIGFTPDEMFNFIDMFDVTQFLRMKPSNLLHNFGLDDGSRLTFIMGKMMESKNVSKNITLKELYEISNIHLIITTTCLNNKETLYISRLTHPNMEVLTAFRMSTAIPLIYTPVIYNGVTYIDGGILDNYPIHLFKDDLKSTIGVCIKTNFDYKPNVENMEDFTFAVFSCLIDCVSCNSIKGFEKNTIIINVEEIPIYSAKVTTEDKQKLYNTGIETTKLFCKNFFDKNEQT